MRTFIRHIRKRFQAHTPLITVSISRENLLKNIDAYRGAFPNLSFAPVLKSNAYGHGLLEVADVLDDTGIPFFVVDSYFEARALRAGGIHAPILVIGYTRPEDIAHNRLRNASFALVDLVQARALARFAQKPVDVHLKLDTGMHRHGFLWKELPDVIDLLSTHPFIRVTGIGTHLGDADAKVSTLTDTQRERWHAMAEQLKRSFPTIKHRHIAATKGVRFAEEAEAPIVRLGIGLYGLDTSPDSRLSLTPVLDVETVITSVRDVPKGEPVGYNGTFIPTRPTRVATIPMGYYEGIDRRLSNTGCMLVHGKAASIVGRVSMNMTMLDVTDIPGAAVGDEVIAISRDPSAPNSVERIAKQTGCIPYEVLVHIPAHLRRIVS